MRAFDPVTLRRIITEIQDERKKLSDLFLEWEKHRFRDWTDTILLRGMASIFHDFYCGAENIFRRIAPELSGGLPDGPVWHKRLLRNMSLQIPEVRPAVISAATLRLLDEFLDFCHKFRHIYGFDLDFQKLDDLERIYSEAHKKFTEDVDRFLLFLEGLINAIETKSQVSAME